MNVKYWLTFDFYYCEPSSKSGTIALDLTVVVAIFGVAYWNDDGGIRTCGLRLNDANTRYTSSPLVCATRRWIRRNTTMKTDFAANKKWTL